MILEHDHQKNTVSVGSFNIELDISDIQLSFLSKSLNPFLNIEKKLNSNSHWKISTSEFPPKSEKFRKIILLQEAEAEICLYFSESQREIIIIENIPDEVVAQNVLRLVRVLFRLDRVENGDLFLHAGMVSFRGSGVAFVGDKRAGKTTTILSCLRRGADFVSNDDLSMILEGDKLHGIGWPRGVSVRGDSLVKILGKNDLNTFYENLEHPGNRRIRNHTFGGAEKNGLVFFYPFEIGRYMKCELRKKSQIDYIVLPKFSDDFYFEPQLKRISEDKVSEELSNHILINPGKYNDFLVSSFSLPNREMVLDRYISHLKKIPIYSLEQGFHRIDEGAKLLENLVSERIQ